MSDEKLSLCAVCNQEFDCLGNESVKICSSNCTLGSNHISEIVEDLANLERKPEDMRVFFYDVGFGKLADLYTVFTLRWVYSRSLSAQKEILVQLEKLAFSLRTKLNKCCLPQDIKARICGKIKDLYYINATMWRIRNSESKHGYFRFAGARDIIRAELDQLIEGRVKVTRL